MLNASIIKSIFEFQTWIPNENMTFFTVPRGCRCGISQWTRLCFIIIAFDGWSSSCRFAQDKNSFAIISHSIYLGCGHTYPVVGCQVCQF